MKALTVYQPWSSLIMLGAKRYEFRSWDYSARFPSLVGQRIVNHASARPVKLTEVLDTIARVKDGDSALDEQIALPLLERLRSAFKCRGVVELSAGLGTAIIGKPIRATDLFADKVNDSDRIDHTKWAWPLTDITPFDAPIPRRGAQGFWNWS